MRYRHEHISFIWAGQKIVIESMTLRGYLISCGFLAGKWTNTSPDQPITDVNQPNQLSRDLMSRRTFFVSSTFVFGMSLTKVIFMRAVHLRFEISACAPAMDRSGPHTKPISIHGLPIVGQCGPQACPWQKLFSCGKKIYVLKFWPGYRLWPQQTRESKDRGETVVRQRRARDVMEDIQFDGQDDGNLESMDLEALTLWGWTWRLGPCEDIQFDGWEDENLERKDLEALTLWEHSAWRTRRWKLREEGWLWPYEDT